MSTLARGAAFAAILIAVFALAALAGAEISPSADAAPEHDGGADTSMEEHSAQMEESG